MSRALGRSAFLVLGLAAPALHAQGPGPAPEPAPAPAPVEPPPVEPAPAPPPEPAPPPRRGSGPPVWVNLKNGTSIKGLMISSEPGRVAVIETEDGWELSIGWDRIESIGAEAPKAPEPAPRGAVPEPPPSKRGYTGPRGGLRLGLGLPFGSIADGDQSELSRVFGTNADLHADLGVQASPALYVGVYAAYAMGSPGSDFSGVCESYDCSVYGLRLGVNFMLTLSPEKDASAWLGYGVGWSADEIDIERPEGKRQLALGGVDFARLSGGYDFRLSESFVAGPYAAFNGGMYLYSVRGLDGVGSADEVDSPKLKAFIVLGARVMVNP